MNKENGYSSTFSISAGVDAAIGAAYYFVDNIYASAMIGYLQTSSSSYVNQIGSSTIVDVVAHNVQVPLEIGLDLPFNKWLGVVFETGPTLYYAVSGYTKTDKEKISFSKMENDYNKKIKRFGALYKLSAGLYLAGYRLQFVYGLPLTKSTTDGKKKYFWGISLGAIL